MNVSAQHLLPQPAVFLFGAEPLRETTGAGSLAGEPTPSSTVLGGKGAGLATMSLLGIPVPPGFTISTAACTFYNQQRTAYPGPLREEVEAALRHLEVRMHAGFGDPTRPLLVSVRSGAPVSMPGMMDTVLNVGLTRATLAGLGARSGTPRFALDCYRRLIEMFGDVVRGIGHGRFQAALAGARARAGVQHDHQLGVAELERVVAEYEELYREGAGEEFPQDPRQQLWAAIDAVFESWNAPRAVTYRRIHHIPPDLGTAVNVQAMVFGNLGPRSATGVAFTRDPASGAPVFYGEFLPNAQGEDVVAGIRTPQPMRRDEGGDLPSFEELFPRAYDELLEVRTRLEHHFGDMQDLEFTVQEDELFVLQTRSGKRTGVAAVRIATDLVAEGLLDERAAVAQVDAASLEQLLAPSFSQQALCEAQASGHALARGLAAGPGAAAGRVALSAARAMALVRAGQGPVILVRHETSPEDIAGMEIAAGIVTARGGMTSHAAVVARGMGKPCVVGCETLHIDEAAGYLECAGTRVAEGDAVSIDGASGMLYLGSIPAQPSEVLRALAGELPPDSAGFQRFARFMAWTDTLRTLGVRANADTPGDARRARQLGAQGIGLCRTEHMFFEAQRIFAFRRMILAPDAAVRTAALAELLEAQRSDFVGILTAMDGLPVTIRLLDPPLHEFLPQTDEDVERFAEQTRLPVGRVRALLEETREANPMLGVRGCRLGLVHPEIYAMQLRAIVEATLAVRTQGGTPVPEIMIPLTSSHTETDALRALFEDTARAVHAECGTPWDASIYRFGTMIEVPRAALTADRLARNLDFFSFGTNDLTQMTFGLSRDDTAALLVDYVEKGRYPHDPFASLDREGVGLLMELAVTRARAVKPDLKIGICGEHGGDPASIAFFRGLGFDYVSCSPLRIPTARTAAAQPGTHVD